MASYQSKSILSVSFFKTATRNGCKTAWLPCKIARQTVTSTPVALAVHKRRPLGPLSMLFQCSLSLMAMFCNRFLQCAASQQLFAASAALGKEM